MEKVPSIRRYERKMDLIFERDVITFRTTITSRDDEAKVVSVKTYGEVRDQLAFDINWTKDVGFVVKNEKRKNSTPTIKVGSVIFASKIVNILVGVD